MLLAIGKPVQFDSQNLPLRGQTQPQSPDWRLRMIEHGTEEVLYTGTYYACRHIQHQCAELTVSSEIREKVKEIVANLGDEPEDTVVLNPYGEDVSPNFDAEETRIEMPNPPGEEGTVAIPRAQMEDMARKRREDLDS